MEGDADSIGKQRKSLVSSFKGGLHDLSIKPWLFVDNQMETDYQQDCINNLVDRIKYPCQYFIFPYVLISRAILLPIRINSGIPWTMGEIALSCFRIFCFVITVILVFANWNRETKDRLGYFALYFARFLCLLGAILQLGIY